MKLFRYLAVSFSLYSKIPMPKFNWQEEDMSRSLAFFPCVGMVIGAVEYLIYMLCVNMGLNLLTVTFAMGVIPLIITGGFHVDGYMDTMDALCSYKSREEKLQILKDPHIGAFSVIYLLIYVLMYGCVLSILIDRGDSESVILFCLTFVVSRCVSGILALTLKKAKNSGMLAAESSTKNKAVIANLIVLLIGCIILGCVVNITIWIAGIILSVLGTGYYRCKVYKEFGGATGDTAGYLVLLLELLMLTGIALGIMIF